MKQMEHGQQRFRMEHWWELHRVMKQMAFGGKHTQNIILIQEVPVQNVGAKC